MLNLTPHTVTVRPLNGGPDIVYPPSGEVARIEMHSAKSDPLPDGCPTIVVTYGHAELPVSYYDGDIPEPCIVSTMFADAYRAQNGFDNVAFFVPDSGPSAIRENGQIVAVRALIRR